MVEQAVIDHSAQRTTAHIPIETLKIIQGYIGKCAVVRCVRCGGADDVGELPTPPCTGTIGEVGRGWVTRRGPNE